MVDGAGWCGACSSSGGLQVHFVSLEDGSLMEEETYVPYTVNATILVDDTETMVTLLQYMVAIGLVTKFNADKPTRMY